MNALNPRRYGYDVQCVFFKHITMIDIFNISPKTALLCISIYPVDDESTFVQIMSWFRPATGHLLNECWLWSPGPQELANIRVVFYRACSNSGLFRELGSLTTHQMRLWHSIKISCLCTPFVKSILYACVITSYIIFEWRQWLYIYIYICVRVKITDYTLRNVTDIDNITMILK